MKRVKLFTTLVLIFIVVFALQGLFRRYLNERKVLKQVIQRLQADSRVAEVLVTGVNYDEDKKKLFTTIKFLEYGIDRKPLEPKYFTFSGNIIQFQSLVIRFNDDYVRDADALRGKSIFLFWKVFILDGADTQEYEITKVKEIPEGYKIEGLSSPFEKKLWRQFWKYALDPKQGSQPGIKNAQLEAPGTMFIPGIIYTIKIEHDGGLRIDPAVIPEVLKGEKIIK
ncbi:MAG: hypothetical protein KJ619_07160 [Candidatus Omnitrophica bacterium]|nr:hypothetical protein [Candidatus Omnitrophota bacterium]